MEKNNLPPVYQAFFNHISPPPGQGNASFALNLSSLLSITPFIPAIIMLFFNNTIINWISTFYVLIVLIFYLLLIASFKKSMIFVSNPFDFVKVQLYHFVLVTITFGFINYFLWRINNHWYIGTIHSFFDMIYYSFVTVTTVGYGDISPTSIISRVFAILEVFFGLWFVVTVVPVAVADQAEKIRHNRETRKELIDEILKAEANGDLTRLKHNGDEREEQ